MTNSIQWEAIEQWLLLLGLTDTVPVGQILEVIEKPRETLSEALDMVGIDYEDLHAFDLEAFEVEVPVKGYIPLFDPLGPYLFYPSHCY